LGKLHHADLHPVSQRPEHHPQRGRRLALACPGVHDEKALLLRGGGQLAVVRLLAADHLLAAFFVAGTHRPAPWVRVCSSGAIGWAPAVAWASRSRLAWRRSVALSGPAQKSARSEVSQARRNASLATRPCR